MQALASPGRCKSAIGLKGSDLCFTSIAVNGFTRVHNREMAMVRRFRDKVAMVTGGNSGIGRFVPFEAVTGGLFDETMATNLKGPFFTIQKAVPLLSRGAAVVLKGSINAHMGMPNSSVYGASKVAVVNLARTLSADLLQQGVRVNAVSPGPVATPILDRMGLPEEQTRQTKEWITGQIPLKRFGQPDEIAAAVLYLSSSESGFVVGTGQVIDSGMIRL
jgi:NAD(P)-dependent dehydrogenase (short-subunit alcohol dehydrogenase family)